jgi:hypothetical protein
MFPTKQKNASRICQEIKLQAAKVATDITTERTLHEDG